MKFDAIPGGEGERFARTLLASDLNAVDFSPTKG